MADVPASFGLPVAAEYWDVSFWISSRPAGVASNDRSSFSLSWSVLFEVIGPPVYNFEAVNRPLDEGSKCVADLFQGSAGGFANDAVFVSCLFRFRESPVVLVDKLTPSTTISATSSLEHPGPVNILLRQVVEDRRRGGPLAPNRIGGLIQMDQAASDERGTERTFSPHPASSAFTLGLSSPNSSFPVSSILKPAPGKRSFDEIEV
jgi:hypothetical protein